MIEIFKFAIIDISNQIVENKNAYQDSKSVVVDLLKHRQVERILVLQRQNVNLLPGRNLNVDVAFTRPDG